MKVGDLVKVIYDGSTGLVIGIEQGVKSIEECDFGDTAWVYLHTGESFRADKLEVISTALTDEQLDNVVGGMSPQKFSNWRAEKLNEGQ